MGVIALLSLTAAVATKTLSFEQAFQGFSDKIVWLVVFAFFIAYFIFLILETRYALMILNEKKIGSYNLSKY